MTLHLHKSTLAGTAQAPPSKSMAHRMLLCAALSQGLSHVSNLDYSVDIITTTNALRQLGATIECNTSSAVVQGLPGAFAALTQPVHCAESGSTLRFIIPLFSLTAQEVTFTGAPRLFARPLTPYEEIFRAQGLSFCPTAKNLTIRGALSSGEYTLAGNLSSQFVSGLLFALPTLGQDSILHITPPFESRSYALLTLQAQQLFGVKCNFEDEYTISIPGNQQYTPNTVAVEGDWSQAAVPAVLAAVLGGIAITGVLPTSAQGDRVILHILERCGASIRWQGDLLHITPPPNGLHSPGDIDLSDCPDLGPILCALALFCRGTTRLVGAGRLRLKESDRIACIQSEFRTLGAQVSSTQDSISIEGGHPLRTGCTTNSHNDHRIVMALCTAALCGGVDVQVQDAQAIQKSWPRFFADLQTLGATLSTQGEDT